MLPCRVTCKLLLQPGRPQSASKAFRPVQRKVVKVSAFSNPSPPSEADAAFFKVFVTELGSKLDKLESKIDSKFDKVDTKLDKLAADVQQVKLDVEVLKVSTSKDLQAQSKDLKLYLLDLHRGCTSVQYLTCALYVQAATMQHWMLAKQ
ncbi:hypothetical protein OEZ85_003680 [Tetradesmus obliquus]|uniref:DUF1664 domain-containing protein n=1 Tax=Tetradesmus obliquus TaxID=3088 RepID=A0ABY8UCC2_TETOB|nr:hypothetical protein OEZ85_003680 [Tetradesmus obliquus]